MSYTAPLKDMMFVMNELAGLAQLSAFPGCEEATAETVEAVLEENARFCGEVVAPLNHPSDQEPSFLRDGKVTVSKGFAEAFKQYGDGGWQGLKHPQEYGGQGLPKLVGTPCMEMLNAASLSFALCPLLTDGAIEALLTAGSDKLKKLFLEKLISGQWTGTMNLTEPQAGSDLALVRSRAVRQDDGTYKVSGTKIFITYGDHEMADNIVHLVLARTPDAPEGIKGISLFVVPKFKVNDDGSLGERNDVQCVSLEHKLGIKASPTAVLQFGDNGGAQGLIVGEENRGLEYMFIMMNAARFAVGVQGLAVSERAYQQAVAYARERVQSRDLAGSANAVAIIRHPDVRRLLMTMRAQIEAARALSYVAAAASDAGHFHPDEKIRKASQSFYEYLVPIVKGWATENAIEVTSAGVQVHGGMGFIEETGAAQHYRDARILAIYEGTTAIQANDLIGRKTVRDEGAVAHGAIMQVRETAARLKGSPDMEIIREQLEQGADALEEVVDYVVANVRKGVKGVFAGSVPYLMMAGVVLGGWQMASAALVSHQKLTAGGGDTAFYQAKIATARFYAEHILPRAQGYRDAIVHGGESVLALAEDQF